MSPTCPNDGDGADDDDSRYGTCELAYRDDKDDCVSSDTRPVGLLALEG